MADLYTLGVGRVRDASTDKPIPATVRLLLESGDAANDVEDYGDVPFSCALGITALPAPKDENGKAEGIAVDVSGYGYACVGARDTRCADVVGKLKAGETAIHNTGGTAETRSRAFFKENCASIIVGNDLVMMLDRKNSKITITGFGHVFELSTAQGITMMTKSGKAAIHLMENGTIDIMGTTINLGGALSASTPATAVLCGVSGISGIPSTAVGAGVYIRP